MLETVWLLLDWNFGPVATSFQGMLTKQLKSGALSLAGGDNSKMTPRMPNTPRFFSSPPGLLCIGSRQNWSCRGGPLSSFSSLYQSSYQAEPSSATAAATPIEKSPRH